MKRAFILAMLLCVTVQLQAQNGTALNGMKEKTSTDSLLSTVQMILKAKGIGKQDTAAAEKIFRRAIARAIKANDLYNAGKAYYEMGEMQFQHKNHNRSLGAFINAKKYFGKTGSEKEQAFTNFSMGRAQYYRGNYKLASGHLSYAMRTAKQLKLTRLESDVLEYLGILYHAMPNPRSQNSDLLTKSLGIKQQLKDQNGELRILEKLAMICYEQKKFDSALYYSNASVLLAEKLSLKYDANLSRLNQIPSLLRLNRVEEVKGRLYSMKKNSIDTADLNMNIRYHIQAGNYHMALRDTAGAQKRYDTALRIAQNSGFPELSSLVYNHMAGASYYNNDFKKAYEYQLLYTNLLATLYSKENFTTYKELEYIFKTNITEDEVKYLSIQNEIQQVRLKNGKAIRLVLMLSAIGFLLSATIIFILYRRQKRKSRIIERQAADLQSHTIGDRQVAEAIKESRNRVQTMAMIHQNLYQEVNMRGIEMEHYIDNLAVNLFSSYNVKKNKILLKTNIDPVSLDVDLVILIGLVLNELISNALKYAFCSKDTGTLSITLRQNEPEGELLLEVKDSGDGFPPGLNIYRTESFGYKLVKAFAHKLKARLEVFNDNGACVQLHIRKFKVIS